MAASLYKLLFGLGAWAVFVTCSRTFDWLSGNAPEREAVLYTFGGLLAIGASVAGHLCAIRAAHVEELRNENTQLRMELIARDAARPQHANGATPGS